MFSFKVSLFSSVVQSTNQTMKEKVLFLNKPFSLSLIIFLLRPTFSSSNVSDIDCCGL